jgi:hypothetical protein
MVGVDLRVDGLDVTDRPVANATGLMFERLAEKGLVEADTTTGLAMVRTGAKRA